MPGNAKSEASDAGNSIGPNTVATVADNEGSRRISVAEANKIFYAEVAQGYDENEPCIADPEARAFARRLVSRAIAATGKRGIRALDACGGSGYASEILLGMGIQTLLVDISPEMLQRWRDKARARGHEPSIQEEEITEFLVRSDASWDLIVFSSALHHLDDDRHAVG